MSRFIETQIALDTHLATLSNSPPVAWENTNYTPIEDTLYIRPSNLPAFSSAVGIANIDSVRGDGFYQVDVFAPSQGGPGAALTVADSISDLFTRGLQLTSGNTLVIVGVPTQDPARASGAWLQVAVLIPYTTLYRS